MSRFIDMDCETIAAKMHEAAKDMDFFDYAGEEAAEIEQLSEALYQVKAIAENPYNSDYWRAFASALMLIFQEG